MNKNEQMLEYIVKCIRATGNDPHDQIDGYIRSGNERYITRNGNARALIKSIDRSQLERYVSDRSA